MRTTVATSDRKHNRFVRHGAIRLCFVFFLGMTTSVVRAAPARVDRVRGEVQKRQAGVLEWQKITPGDKVEEGATLHTGSNSQVDVVTEKGHRLQVRSDSTLEFTSLQADETKVRVENGRVFSKVKKLLPNEHYGIQTPTAVCAVRGTEFEVVTGGMDRGTLISVFRGVVGVMASGVAGEVNVPAGQMTSVRNGVVEPPLPIPRQSQSTGGTTLDRTARHEVGLDMSRNEVIAAAAMERRLADYQEGKSLVDVAGKRVRLDEYIVRPAPNQFKFVVLNERDQQLDYYFYKGTFNQTLPTDLSVALKDLSGKYGAIAPDYYLTAYEMGQSNTQDSVHDAAAGGHLVKVEVNGEGNYVLTDAADPTHTRTILASELQGDGYKIYDPLSDSFFTVSADALDSSKKFGIYIPENDAFKDLAPGDTVWKTRFNEYAHEINNVPKINYTASSAANVLAVDLDMDKSFAGGGGWMSSYAKLDSNNIDATITTYYGDRDGHVTQEIYRTVLIDDNGSIAPRSAFSSVSTGAQYKGELLKWNYEQQISASEFEGRKIDLVVEPRIFLKSGLIQ